VKKTFKQLEEMFDPTKDKPVENQRWVETFWDELLMLVDPTGNEVLTEMIHPFNPKPQKIGGMKFKSMEAVAKYVDKPAPVVQKLIREKRFDVIKTWMEDIKK
jgi:hypothetical protein